MTRVFEALQSIDREVELRKRSAVAEAMEQLVDEQQTQRWKTAKHEYEEALKHRDLEIKSLLMTQQQQKAE